MTEPAGSAAGLPQSVPDEVFQRLYDKHGAAILSDLIRFTRCDRHRAEDIVPRRSGPAPGVCVTRQSEQDEVLTALRIVADEGPYVCAALVEQPQAEMGRTPRELSVGLAPHEIETVRWIALGLTQSQIATPAVQSTAAEASLDGAHPSPVQETVSRDFTPRRRRGVNGPPAALVFKCGTAMPGRTTTHGP